MDRNEFEGMVIRTAMRFSKRHSVTVSEGSIDEIISPALDHLDDVNRDLKLGRMTVPLLEDSVYSILTNARLQALQKDERRIGRVQTRQSLAFYCPYLFWC